MLSIWSSFADLPDSRTGNAQRHHLLDVITIALTATICGAESCVDFADLARDREALFREFLDLPGGLPSHDTFSRLFRLLDPVAFGACLARFLDGVGEAGPGAGGASRCGRVFCRCSPLGGDQAAGGAREEAATARPEP